MSFDNIWLCVFLIWTESLQYFKHNWICAGSFCFNQTKMRKLWNRDCFLNCASLILWLFYEHPIHNDVDISCWKYGSLSLSLTILILSWNKIGIFENYSRIGLRSRVFDHNFHIVYTLCGLRFVFGSESTATLCSNTEWH